MPVVSIAMALTAAVLFAVSVTLQQNAARTTALRLAAHEGPPLGHRPWLPVLGLLGPLLRNPAWLVGWGLNVAGFAAHSVALHLGSITVVQTVLVIQLILTLSFAATLRRHRLAARDWCGAVVVCAGVVLLIVERGDVPQAIPPTNRVVAAMVLAFAIIATLVGLARVVGHHGQVRTALTAVGAGVSFCVTAILVIVFTDDLARDGFGAIVHWPLCGVVVSAVVGSLLVQDSFASGSLPTALVAMTVTDPVSSCAAGLLLFESARPTGLGAIGGLAGALVLVAVGVVVIATSPTLRRDASGS